MDLIALSYKEAITVRRNPAPILLLVVLLPSCFALGTVVYGNTVPQDVPVAVVAADESATEEDLAIVRSGVGIVGEPREYGTTDEAVEALERVAVVLDGTVRVDGEPAADALGQYREIRDGRGRGLAPPAGRGRIVDG